MPYKDFHTATQALKLEVLKLNACLRAAALPAHQRPCEDRERNCDHGVAIGVQVGIWLLEQLDRGGSERDHRGKQKISQHVESRDARDSVPKRGDATRCKAASRKNAPGVATFVAISRA